MFHFLLNVLDSKWSEFVWVHYDYFVLFIPSRYTFGSMEAVIYTSIHELGLSCRLIMNLHRLAFHLR